MYIFIYTIIIIFIITVRRVDMKAILPVLDKTKKKPYYLQLYDYISEAIIHGEIMESEKLPSLRSLAKSTGLSITTIEQCYNQLLVEGYIYSKAQSGYYVGNVFSHSKKNIPPVPFKDSSFSYTVSSPADSKLHKDQFI